MQMSVKEIVLGFLLACVASVGRCELFTSMAHLQSALYAERDIATVLKTYVETEEQRLNEIKRVAEDLASHSEKALEDPDFYLANPVNAFLFMKRFTLDWGKNIDHLIKNDSSETMRRYVEHYRQELPKYEDLQGAASALMRLQDTYKLDTAKIAQGDLRGVKSSILTANDCFEIGKLSYNSEDYVHTSEWMGETLGRLNNEEEKLNSSVHRAEVLDYMAFSEYRKGNIKNALSFTEELLLLEPDHERAVNNKQYYERMLQDRGTTEDEEDPPMEATLENLERSEMEYKNSEEFKNYEALCRGENIMEIADKHKLRCRYRDNNNPRLILSPVKEEDVFLNPWIVIYHNVMSDTEISDIQRLATPRLNRATVQNSKTGELETATYRISKSAWLKSEDDPTVARINSRIEAITGLNVETAEELQVANYGLGGHYEPHFDFARSRKLTAFEERVGNRIATFLFYKEEKDAFKSLGTGNRIATFLFYMSDVAAGGATVFPYIGVKLFPEKGAAAFWYNLYRSGEGIYNTRHAACPVLVGTKWVSNKWIHERGQEFRRPCSLSTEE